MRLWGSLLSGAAMVVAVALSCSLGLKEDFAIFVDGLGRAALGLIKQWWLRASPLFLVVEGLFA